MQPDEDDWRFCVVPPGHPNPQLYSRDDEIQSVINARDHWSDVGGEAEPYYPVRRAPASDAGEISGYPVWVRDRSSVATGVHYRPRVNQHAARRRVLPTHQPVYTQEPVALSPAGSDWSSVHFPPHDLRRLPSYVSVMELQNFPEGRQLLRRVIQSSDEAWAAYQQESPPRVIQSHHLQDPYDDISAPRGVIHEHGQVGPSVASHPQFRLEENTRQATGVEYHQPSMRDAPPAQFQHPPARDTTPAQYHQPSMRDAPPVQYQQPPTRDTTPAQYHQPSMRDAPPAQYQQPPARVTTPAQYHQPSMRDAPPAQYQQPPARDTTPAQYHQPSMRDAPPAQYQQPPTRDTTPAQYHQPSMRDAPPAQYQQPPARDTTPAQYHQPSMRDAPPAQYQQPPTRDTTPAQYHQPSMRDAPPAQYQQPPARDTTPAQYHQPSMRDEAPAQSQRQPLRVTYLTQNEGGSHAASTRGQQTHHAQSQPMQQPARNYTLYHVTPPEASKSEARWNLEWGRDFYVGQDDQHDEDAGPQSFYYGAEDDQDIISVASTTTYNRWLALQGPASELAPPYTGHERFIEYSFSNANYLDELENETLRAGAPTAYPRAAGLRYIVREMTQDRDNMRKRPPFIWYHSCVIDLVAANLTILYNPIKFLKQVDLPPPSIQFEDDMGRLNENYAKHVIQAHNIMGPWLLVQRVSRLLQNRNGSSVSNMLLLESGKLYDVVCLLEVARVCVFKDIFSTWFKMLKLVMPNQDVAFCNDDARHDTRGKDIINATQVLVEQQALLHPWLRVNEYPPVVPQRLVFPHVRYVGPIAISATQDFLVVVNPVQVLTAVDWARENIAGFESTIWHNLAGLLDVFTYLLGPLGPLASRMDIVTNTDGVDGLDPRWRVVQKWKGVREILEEFYIYKIEFRRMNLQIKIWANSKPSVQGEEHQPAVCPVCRKVHSPPPRVVCRNQSFSSEQVTRWMICVLNLQRGTTYVECPCMKPKNAHGDNSNKADASAKKLRNDWISYVYNAEPRDKGNFTKKTWTKGPSADPRDPFLPSYIGGQARVAPTAILMSAMQAYCGLEAMSGMLLDQSQQTGRLEKLYMDDPRNTIVSVPHWHTKRQLRDLTYLNQRIRDFLVEMFGPRNEHDLLDEPDKRWSSHLQIYNASVLPSQIHGDVPRWGAEREVNAMRALCLQLAVQTAHQGYVPDVHEVDDDEDINLGSYQI